MMKQPSSKKYWLFTISKLRIKKHNFILEPKLLQKYFDGNPYW